MRTFHLTFNLESDGAWYIEFPGYPFAHHNLMMVAGADQLCAYVANLQGRTDKAIVDVTLNDKHLEGKEPDLVLERFKKGYGAHYFNYTKEGVAPEINANGRSRGIDTSWLCPVTLLVLGSYPKKINLYIPNNNHE